MRIGAEPPAPPTPAESPGAPLRHPPCVPVDERAARAAHDHQRSHWTPRTRAPPSTRPDGVRPRPFGQGLTPSFRGGSDPRPVPLQTSRQVTSVARRTWQRMHRAAAMPRVRSVPRLPRAAVWALAVLALLVAGMLWLRDSSLVAVRNVTVTGLTGPETARVTAQLQAAARDMTTLHVRGDQLRSVVEPYPVVKALRVSTDFPHGLRITIVENPPVAAIVADGGRTPVGAD